MVHAYLGSVIHQKQPNPSLASVARRWTVFLAMDASDGMMANSEKLGWKKWGYFFGIHYSYVISIEGKRLINIHKKVISIFIIIK